MKRILAISLCIVSVLFCIAILIVFHRGNIIEQQKQEIAKRDVMLQEKDMYIASMENAVAVYAEADAQAKEFEKELNDDTTDNLDVVPADYILKQLRAD